ncbi:LAMI_0E09780g1_1 [Lachancea mirantina]|uniref:LAMI_0E09780g1_1 n=1 Tax=Lachancea mirantina TaxID=1230905 RepID=A0A1G4JNR2_9SACH|nr:LAMI_0E09780g1_1 [Lachancea mirantina]
MGPKRVADSSWEQRKELNKSVAPFWCNEPPCNGVNVPAELISMHVQQMHENVCEACGLNLINEWSLELHLSECHDPFRPAKGAFMCYEMNCDEHFENHLDRVQHLKDNHNYPDDYPFDFIYEGYTD